MVAIAMLFRAENNAKIRLDVLLSQLASVIIVVGTPIIRYHSTMVNKKLLEIRSSNSLISYYLPLERSALIVPQLPT
jgi:hypothetical protein